MSDVVMPAGPRPGPYRCSRLGCSTVQEYEARGAVWVLPASGGPLDCPGECDLKEVVRQEGPEADEIRATFAVLLAAKDVIEGSADYRA